MEAATTTQAQAAPPPRLRERYEQDVKPALIDKFGYATPMQAPRLQKIVLNMGVGEARQNAKMLEAAQGQLATIAGQYPNVRRARKSIASFKVREGMPVGLSATLRRARMWEFLDRLCSIAIPRIRDFRGLNPRSFDGRGNYSMGVKEQLIFPEIDYDSIDEVRGFDITIATSAATDVEAFELLLRLGMPFAKEGRPGGAVDRDAEAEAEEEKRKEEARRRAEAEQAALEQLKEENPEAYEKPEREAPGPAGPGAEEGTPPSSGGEPTSTPPAGEAAPKAAEKAAEKENSDG
jgi:large subunit ribosomal protein L5